MKTKTIDVYVHLYSQSQPILHKDVINTYQKGDMFCLYTIDEEVTKYPMQHIFRVKEGYGYHGR
jgi:hypothetical protein